MPSTPGAEDAVKRKEMLEKDELLLALQGAMELPMVILSFIMLALFLVEITADPPAEWRRVINLAQWAIWVTFVVEFVVKLSLAPSKLRFLKRNWLMGAAIALPVLRVFRLLRAVRALRTAGTLRVIAVGNRTIRKLGILFERRHLQYLLSVVIAVDLLGAAGMYYLERGIPGANITTFGSAVWWASGTLTTVGTELYPLSAEGRVLAIVMMIFGVSVFGYIAGSLASLFVDLDSAARRESEKAEPEGYSQLQEEIHQLEERIAALVHMVPGEHPADHQG